MPDLHIVKGRYASITDMQRQVERGLALHKGMTTHWSYSSVTGFWSVVIIDRHGNLRGDLAVQVQPRFTSKIHVR